MQDAAQIPFEDEPEVGGEADVDAVIRAAGGDAREAIRALLVDLAEARTALGRMASLGYRRGRQPGRRLP